MIPRCIVVLEDDDYENLNVIGVAIPQDQTDDGPCNDQTMQYLIGQQIARDNGYDPNFIVCKVVTMTPVHNPRDEDDQ